MTHLFDVYGALPTAAPMQSRPSRLDAVQTASDGAAVGGESTAKSARTRLRVMDSAAEVLSRKGYAGTRISDIAAEASVQSSAIYYYFESREDLLEAVMMRGASELRSHVAERLAAMSPHADALDRIDTAVEAHLRLSLQLSAYTTATIRNLGQVPEDVRGRLLAIEEDYGLLWEELFATARAQRKISDSVDLYTMRMLVLGAVNWAAEWWNPQTGPIEALVETTKAIVRGGISTPRSVDLKPRFLSP